MKASVFRMAHFNAAHSLHNENWTAQKNEEVFGLCNNEFYHGHNYELEVRVTGEIDPETGYVYDLGKLAQIIHQNIEKKFDHKNLNLQLEEFKTVLPSAENMAVVIYGILRALIDEKYEIGIRLWETPRNFVQFPA